MGSGQQQGESMGLLGHPVSHFYSEWMHSLHDPIPVTGVTVTIVRAHGGGAEQKTGEEVTVRIRQEMLVALFPVAVVQVADTARLEILQGGTKSI